MDNAESDVSNVSKILKSKQFTTTNNEALSVKEMFPMFQRY